MAEEKVKVDFDSLPMVRHPSPLPCGCGIKAVPGLNWNGTRTEHRDSHIVYCVIHGAAPELHYVLECVWAGVTDARRKALDGNTPDETLVMIPMLWGTVKKVRAAISKAKSTVTDD